MPRKQPSANPTAADTAAEDGIADLSFESAIEELETIVSRMEEGELSLQDSLQAYQRGAALVGRCRSALDAVSEQVRVLEGNLLKPVTVDELDREQGVG